MTFQEVNRHSRILLLLIAVMNNKGVDCIKSGSVKEGLRYLSGAIRMSGAGLLLEGSKPDKDGRSKCRTPKCGNVPTGSMTRASTYADLVDCFPDYRSIRSSTMLFENAIAITKDTIDEELSKVKKNNENEVVVMAVALSTLHSVILFNLALIGHKSGGRAGDFRMRGRSAVLAKAWRLYDEASDLLALTRNHKGNNEGLAGALRDLVAMAALNNLIQLTSLDREEIVRNLDGNSKIKLHLQTVEYLQSFIEVANTLSLDGYGNRQIVQRIEGIRRVLMTNALFHVQYSNHFLMNQISKAENDKHVVVV